MNGLILAVSVLMMWDVPISPVRLRQPGYETGLWQSLVCDPDIHFRLPQTNCLLYGQASADVKDCERNLEMAKVDMPGRSYSCAWLKQEDRERPLGRKR